MPVQLYEFLLRNTTSSGITIRDLSGLYIPASGTVDITDLFTFSRLVDSPQLDTLLTSEDVIAVAGGEDVPAERMRTFLSYKDSFYLRGIPVGSTASGTEIPPGGGGINTKTGAVVMKYDRDNDLLDLNEIDFLELGDTPAVYGGEGLKFVRVNENEQGLHFENAIVGVTSSGTTPPEDSNLWYNTTFNEFFYYDPVRGDWLSLTVHNYLFAYQGSISGFYMSVGDVRHSYAHYPIPRPATVTAIIATAQESVNSSKGFEVRDDTTTVSGFNMVNWSYTDMDANIALDEGAKLKMFVTSAGQNVKHPIVTLEVRWRYEE